MIRLHRPRVGAGAGAGAGAALCAVTLAAAATLPAQAATVPAQPATGTGWRVVFTHHYRDGHLANVYSLYAAVVAPGRHDAWVFGNSDGSRTGSPVAEHWAGSHWRAATLPAGLTGGITVASATSGSDIWAAGSSIDGGRPFLLRRKGTGWAVARRWPSGGALGKVISGVTAVSRSDVWVFGSPGAAPGIGTWHYNGHRWRQVTTGAALLTSASALSAGSIWAFARTAGTQDLIEHYNGTKWRTVPTGSVVAPNFQLSSILALSRKSVWVSGSTTSGKSVLLHYNGASWSRVAVPGKHGFLFGLTSDGAGGIWVLTGTVPLHRSASGRWSSPRISAKKVTLFGLALIPGTTSLWGAASQLLAGGSDAAILTRGRV